MTTKVILPDEVGIVKRRDVKPGECFRWNGQTFMMTDYKRMALCLNDGEMCGNSEIDHWDRIRCDRDGNPIKPGREKLYFRDVPERGWFVDDEGDTCCKMDPKVAEQQEANAVVYGRKGQYDYGYEDDAKVLRILPNATITFDTPQPDPETE